MGQVDTHLDLVTMGRVDTHLDFGVHGAGQKEVGGPWEPSDGCHTLRVASPCVDVFLGQEALLRWSVRLEVDPSVLWDV